MAYKAELSNSGPTGTAAGPRVNLGTDADPFQYFVVGAFNRRNNIDTKDRVLKIFGSNDTLNLRIVGLPDASTAPDGADLEAVVIDKSTGQLYIQ